MNGNGKLGKNIREIIFGVEDGAIGNLGLLVGMAQAMSPNKLILLAGLATMFAQAASMSAGNYLSIKSEKEYFQVKSKSRQYGQAYSRRKDAIFSSFIMALSVIIGAAIPWSVFFFWKSSAGIIPAIAVTLLGLFLLGALKTKYTLKNWFKSGLQVMFVGFITATVGYILGYLFV